MRNKRVVIAPHHRSGKDHNKLTFITPHKPNQDCVTRAQVRLLGPCFKTGQVGTDLLATDCTRTPSITAQHRRTNATSFPHKVRKDSLRQRSPRTATGRPLYMHTPRKRGNFTPSQYTEGKLPSQQL